MTIHLKTVPRILAEIASNQVQVKAPNLMMMMMKIFQTMRTAR